MTINVNQFKQAMSQFPTGVTVVTTLHQGQPIGITASAFSSLSLDPPLVLVSLNKELFTHRVMEDSGIFAVNILSAHQQALGMRFAGLIPNLENRFAGLETATAVTGCPLLPDCLAWMDCTLWASYDGGDHTIFVGEVKDVYAGEMDMPLLYHNRLWRRSEALEIPTVAPDVTIIEVGPRDGLQTQAKFVPTAMKVDLIRKLAAAGVKRIQVTSFVNPKLVPQMVDAAEVCAQLPAMEGVIYNGLVLNMKGLERAYAAGLKDVDMGVPASETLSQKNSNCSIEEGMQRMTDMVSYARERGMRVRAGVQTAFGCVYEGQIERAKVVQLARRFLAMGIDELSLADSAGLGNPNQVRRMVQELRPYAAHIPIVLHLHDTRGMGLANALAALKSGITHFDTSFGGLGGCPFIVGAKGNIATEDTVHMLHEMGIGTAVDVAGVAAVSREMAAFLGQELPGKMYQLSN